MIPSLSLLFTALLFAGVHGTITNYTMDDQNPDPFGNLPTFTGPVDSTGNNGWNPNSGVFDIDTRQAFDGTWHDATYEPDDQGPKSISMNFTGMLLDFKTAFQCL